MVPEKGPLNGCVLNFGVTSIGIQCIISGAQTDKQVEDNVGNDDVECAEVDQRRSVVAAVRLPVVTTSRTERRRHLVMYNDNNNLVQVVHTCVLVINQYNSLLVKW